MELSPLYGVSHWRKQLFPYTVILIIEGASGGPGRKEKMRMKPLGLVGENCF